MRFLLIWGIWVMPVMSASASTDEDSLRDESFGYWQSLTKSIEPFDKLRSRIFTWINSPGYEVVMEKSDIFEGQVLRLIRRRGSCEAKDTYFASLQDAKGKQLFKAVHTYPVCKIGLIFRWREGFVYHVKDRSQRKRAFYISVRGENREITADPEYSPEFFSREAIHSSDLLHPKKKDS